MGTMRITLTAGQSVTIHGWMNPKETLTWSEVLHRLQPDIGAWASAKKVELQDIASLAQWGYAHPIRDLKADLGDLIHLGWPAANMRRAGVAYSDLVEAGMTPDSMVLFGYTLYDWITLGFSESDAAGFSAPALGRLFGLTRADVSRCFIGGKGAQQGLQVTGTASKS